jgi:hypothetical protein
MISGRDNFNILSETIYLVEIDFLNKIKKIWLKVRNSVYFSTIENNLITFCHYQSNIYPIAFENIDVQED